MVPRQVKGVEREGEFREREHVEEITGVAGVGGTESRDVVDGWGLVYTEPEV